MRCVLLLLVLSSVACAAAGDREIELSLSLVPIKQGIAQDRLARRVKQAQELGLDLHHPDHPLLVHSYTNGRLFYVFYKTLAGAVGPQHYVLQRIRKEERFYMSATDREPRTVVTFLVEAFKLRDGQLKKADEHFASLGIANYHKRETIKEYEIGFGEIPEIATGTAWPFDPGVLYKAIQPYGPEQAIYDRVRFTQSLKWKLSVTFDQAGSYSIRSPELGFDAPSRLPEMTKSQPVSAAN